MWHFPKRGSRCMWGGAGAAGETQISSRQTLGLWGRDSRPIFLQGWGGAAPQRLLGTSRRPGPWIWALELRSLTPRTSLLEKAGKEQEIIVLQRVKCVGVNLRGHCFRDDLLSWGLDF